MSRTSSYTKLLSKHQLSLEEQQFLRNIDCELNFDHGAHSLEGTRYGNCLLVTNYGLSITNTITGRDTISFIGALHFYYIRHKSNNSHEPNIH